MGFHNEEKSFSGEFQNVLHTPEEYIQSTSQCICTNTGGEPGCAFVSVCAIELLDSGRRIRWNTKNNGPVCTNWGTRHVGSHVRCLRCVFSRHHQQGACGSVRLGKAASQSCCPRQYNYVHISSERSGREGIIVSRVGTRLTQPWRRVTENWMEPHFLTVLSARFRLGQPLTF
jgi:hypothetical protein